ncbi:hypothetical protein TNIN_389141 [Trichonephila inaurata madagascariensis]|uniref:Uncharacterized protein n=1 Tax=Trichonephila inaurata madagascariensis TaxID=2747483 RepID=A0A8X7CTH2_9ARAC|nr:hypothetical protein TNIN_389141 [Trichonephila inaurata madagascariensis]
MDVSGVRNGRMKTRAGSPIMLWWFLLSPVPRRRIYLGRGSRGALAVFEVLWLGFFEDCPNVIVPADPRWAAVDIRHFIMPLQSSYLTP